MVIIHSSLCFTSALAVSTPTALRPACCPQRQATTRQLFRYDQPPKRLRPTATAAVPSAANGTSTTPSTVTPSPNPAPSDPDNTTPTISVKVANNALRTLFQYFNDLSAREPFIRNRLILAVACIVLSKLIGLTVPFFFKEAVDALMSAQPGATSAAAAATITSAVTAILLHGLARVLASVTHEFRNAFFARGGQRVGRSITATTFAHLHSLELGFHSGSRTGAVTRIVDRGTRSIMTIFRAVIFSFFPSFFELLLVCTVLFRSFSPTYVLVTLATFAAFTAWTLSINTVMGRIRAQMNGVENEASAKLTDSLINVESVKIYDNARHETHRYDQALSRYEDVAIRNEKLYARLNIGQTAAYTVGLTVLLLLATFDVVAGRISVGSVVLLTTMLQRLWIPLDFLGWQYREVKQSLIDVQNLFDILKREPAVKDVKDAKPIVVTEGRIVFENVCFRYPSGEAALPFVSKSSAAKQNGTDSAAHHNGSTKKARRRVAIDDLSFSVPGGSSVALVGASGSGKSTITRLLSRLYNVGGGRILIDGQDIATASMSSLRQAVSIVPQDTTLFNDTIEYNIRYGRPSATDEEVVEAAKAASIHDVIMRTEHGYKSLVGERGVRLSGGERQRLSIARAFLKGSRIIVEDETTSSLDTLTELEVSNALRNLGLNRTRIIVAHRLSTIMNVDQVLVMRSGKLVEQGTFDELVNRHGGVFKAMWERQQRKSENNEDIDDDDEEDSEEYESDDLTQSDEDSRKSSLDTLRDQQIHKMELQ